MKKGKTFKQAVASWRKHPDVKVVALKRKGKWTAAGKKSKYYVPTTRRRRKMPKKKRKYNPNTLGRKLNKMSQQVKSVVKFVAQVGATAGPGLAVGGATWAATKDPISAFAAGTSVYTGVDVRPGADNTLPTIVARLATGWTPTLIYQGIKMGLRFLGA